MLPRAVVLPSKHSEPNNATKDVNRVLHCEDNTTGHFTVSVVRRQLTTQQTGGGGRGLHSLCLILDHASGREGSQLPSRSFVAGGPALAAIVYSHTGRVVVARSVKA